jgi:hypothetical protein
LRTPHPSETSATSLALRYTTRTQMHAPDSPPRKWPNFTGERGIHTILGHHSPG